MKGWELFYCSQDSLTSSYVTDYVDSLNLIKITMLDVLVGCQPRRIAPSLITFFISLLNPKFRELGSSVGMATNYGLNVPGLNPGRTKRYFRLQNRPDQICGPIKPFIQWVVGFFPGGKTVGA